MSFFVHAMLDSVGGVGVAFNLRGLKRRRPDEFPGINPIFCEQWLDAEVKSAKLQVAMACAGFFVVALVFWFVIYEFYLKESLMPPSPVSFVPMIVAAVAWVVISFPAGVAAKQAAEMRSQVLGADSRDLASSNGKRIWMKVKILDDNVQLFAALTGAPQVVGIISGRPIVEATKSADENFIEVLLADGRRGFVAIPSLAPIRRLIVRQENLVLRSNTSEHSPEAATVGKGSKLEQIGEPITQGVSVWIPVLTPDGKEGFMESGAAVKDMGNQFRIDGEGQ